MTSLARGGSPDKANRRIFIGAVVLAAVAAVLVFVALSNFGGSKSDNGSLGATVSVVIASRDISAGTKVSSDMLEIATLPKNGVISGALTDKATAVGSTTRANLAKGEQFSDVKLGRSGATKLFSDVVPQGKRAAALKVSETSFVGGLPVAGDHVDITVIGTKDSVDAATTGKQIPTAFVLLQDVEVLSVSDASLKPTAQLDKDGNPITTNEAVGNTAVRTDNTSADPKAQSITLAVDPADVPRVALASEVYKVYVTLRPNGDKSTIQNPNDLISLPANQ